jgi:hypothetical protein
MLDKPYVTGFSISRPDDEGERSLNRDKEEYAIYQHHKLRVADHRPRFSRNYEIYNLGLLLFEIGVWRPLTNIVTNASSLPAAKFTQTVIDRCKKDLPFFMGNQYRDVVVRCLTCADDIADETAASLDTIYWSVVLELAKCG